jgi:hypothetical protein
VYYREVEELLARLLEKVASQVASQTQKGSTRFLLKLWRRSKTSYQTTVQHLIQALNSIYCNDVATEIEKHCKKLHPSATYAEKDDEDAAILLDDHNALSGMNAEVTGKQMHIVRLTNKQINISNKCSFVK